jgi:hypothetical protein
MKRLLAALTLALLFSVVAGSGVASATHTTTDNPPHDFASGSGYVPAYPVSVTISATSGPSGENAKGHYRTMGPSFDQQGPVTCLATAGNIAVVGGPRSDFPAGGFFNVVEDNGTPGEREAAPDRWKNIFGPPPTQQGCETVLEISSSGFGVFFPIDRGNFTVHDAPPADVTP